MTSELMFKGSIVLAGISGVAAIAAQELPPPAGLERLGTIGILGCGMWVAGKIIFMQYNDNKAMQARIETLLQENRARSDSLLRESIDVMRETRDVLKEFGGKK